MWLQSPGWRPGLVLWRRRCLQGSLIYQTNERHKRVSKLLFFISWYLLFLGKWPPWSGLCLPVSVPRRLWLRPLRSRQRLGLSPRTPVLRPVQVRPVKLWIFLVKIYYFGCSKGVCPRAVNVWRELRMICALPAAAVRTVPVSQINVTATPSLRIRTLSVLGTMSARYLLPTPVSMLSNLIFP